MGLGVRDVSVGFIRFRNLGAYGFRVRGLGYNRDWRLGFRVWECHVNVG